MVFLLEDASQFPEIYRVIEFSTNVQSYGLKRQRLNKMGAGRYWRESSWKGKSSEKGCPPPNSARTVLCACTYYLQPFRCFLRYAYDKQGSKEPRGKQKLGGLGNAKRFQQLSLAQETEFAILMLLNSSFQNSETMHFYCLSHSFCVFCYGSSSNEEIICSNI